MGIKKKALLFFFCLFFLPCAISRAQATYTITEDELTKLEQNLNTLQKHSEEKQKLLTVQQQQLQIASKELKIAQTELQVASAKMRELQALTEQTQNSLKSANQYLAIYAKEEQKKRKRLRLERNIAVVLAIFALCR